MLVFCDLPLTHLFLQLFPQVLNLKLHFIQRSCLLSLDFYHLNIFASNSLFVLLLHTQDLILFLLASQ